MEQLLLFEPDNSSHITENFSAGNLCNDTERRKLEEKYRGILKVTDKFDRRSVSWQLSKHDKFTAGSSTRKAFRPNL